MFGADTPLVMDALQIAALAALAGMGGMALIMRMRKKRLHEEPAQTDERPKKADLEDRVRVLERIATDRVQDLDSEIEKLRDAPVKQENA